MLWKKYVTTNQEIVKTLKQTLKKLKRITTRKQKRKIRLES